MTRRLIALGLSLALLSPAPEAAAAARRAIPSVPGAAPVVSLPLSSPLPALPAALPAAARPGPLAALPSGAGSLVAAPSVPLQAHHLAPQAPDRQAARRPEAALPAARALAAETGRAPEPRAALEAFFDSSPPRADERAAVEAPAAPSASRPLAPSSRARSAAGAWSRGLAWLAGAGALALAPSARAQEDPRLFMPLEDGGGQAASGGGSGFIVLFAMIAAMGLLFFGLSRYRKRFEKRRWERIAQEAESYADPVIEPGPDGKPGPVKRVSFDDVAGQDEAKAELQAVVNTLKEPAKYRKLGGEDYKRHKGVLLFGPPGTGKTLLARAVAHQAGAAFFKMNGSEFVEKYVGVGSSRIRELFARARKVKGPAIIFIDEIDALARQRRPGGNEEYEQTVNQLLAEMDGFEKDDVVVIAATNRPESMDPGILRGRRFGLKVPVGLPDRDGRLAILKVLTRKTLLGPDADLGAAAAQTARLSGADLAEIVSDAVGLAGDRDAEAVEQADLLKAVDRFTGGHARKRAMTPEERRTVAVHESGHTLVSRRLAHSDPVRKVTIVPHGLQALGFMQTYEEHERLMPSREWILDRLATLMGGRAAEEVVLGRVSAGAADDFEQASKLARLMVMKLGMSEKVGPVSFDLDGEPPKVGRPLSESMRRLIDGEVRALLGEAMGRAKAAISADRAGLEALAGELLEKETLGPEDLDRVLPPAPVPAAP